jgi:hypothetical protein
MYSAGTTAPSSRPAQITGLSGRSSRIARNTGGSLIAQVTGSVWINPTTIEAKRVSSNSADNVR